MTEPADRLWFLNTLVTIRVSAPDGRDGISVLEHRAPHGDAPPLHLHRTEDEVFHVLEGQLRVRIRDQERRAGAGDILLAPKGVPHAYRVESAQGARFVTVTIHGDFERFVRELGRPAQRSELPEPAAAPTPEAIRALAAAAARHGIEILGPPLA